MQKQFYFLILVLLILPIAALGQEKKYLPVEYITDDALVRISYNEKGLIDSLYSKDIAGDIRKIKKSTYTYYDNNLLKECNLVSERVQLTDEGEEYLSNTVINEKYRYEISDSLIYEYIATTENIGTTIETLPVYDSIPSRIFHLNEKKLPYKIRNISDLETTFLFTYTDNNLLEKITITIQGEKADDQMSLSQTLKGGIENQNRLLEIYYYNYLQIVDYPLDLQIYANQQPSEIYSTLAVMNSAEMPLVNTKIKYDYDQAGCPTSIHLEKLDYEGKTTLKTLSVKYKEINIK